MHKLFALSHLRTLQRLGLTQFVPSKFEEVVAKNNLAVSGEGLLYRLPRQQLKHIVHIPCPINSLEQTHAEAIIKSSKLLRHHIKLQQPRICSKCPFAQKCTFSKKPLENVKYQNTMQDLLNFFYGLHNYLKPDTIFYRQWVSAYRLGDSIVSSIEDLSKGGKQIEEYERIRLEGIKQFQQRMALKKASNPQASSESNFENVMSKLEKINIEKEKPKPKAVKPKEQKEKPAEVLGRDFSFDEEEEFEPVEKFSKKSNLKEPKAEPKGYQRIENNQERSGKTQYKAPYNGKSEKYSNKQPQDEEFKPYQPRQDKPYRKQYQREGRDYVKKDYQREDRGQKGQWSSAPRKTGYQKQYQNNRYGGNDRYTDRRDDRGEGRGQYQREDRGYQGYQGNKDRRDQGSYSSKPSYKPKYQGSDQYPKIKQFGKRSQYKPRDNFNQDQSYTKNQKTPFVSKWKENSEQNPFESSSKPKFQKTSFNKESNFQQNKPKIIEVQNINASENDSSPRGRTIRRRRSSSRPQQDEN